MLRTAGSPEYSFPCESLDEWPRSLGRAVEEPTHRFLGLAKAFVTRSQHFDVSRGAGAQRRRCVAPPCCPCAPGPLPGLWAPRCSP
jgi:hypothetical protein